MEMESCVAMVVGVAIGYSRINTYVVDVVCTYSMW